MRAILITGGVGDVIAIESLMKNEERNSIECIFYATRAATPCIELLTDLPNFPKLKRHLFLWKNFTDIFGFNTKDQLVDKICAYQPEDLQQTVRKLVAPVEDWSIAKIFNEDRPYTYSSFTKYKLADIEKFNLPQDYYCICPYTNNDKRDLRRDYNATDWRETIRILDKKGVTGVIINKGAEAIPQNKRLINLNNKTTVREAIEIIKSGHGYIGIDSAFSVIAAKMYNPENIIIKSLNNHCYRWAHIYYAPMKSFEFMKKTITDQ